MDFKKKYLKYKLKYLNLKKQIGGSLTVQEAFPSKFRELGPLEFTTLNDLKDKIEQYGRQEPNGNIVVQVETENNDVITNEVYHSFDQENDISLIFRFDGVKFMRPFEFYKIGVFKIKIKDTPEYFNYVAPLQ